MAKPKKNNTDTATLLLQLGYKQIGPDHWANGAGSEIRKERDSDYPYILTVNGTGTDDLTSHVSKRFVALSDVYQELLRRAWKAARP